MDSLALHNADSKAALTKMVLRLFALWQIPVIDQAALLGRSTRSIHRYMDGGRIGDDKEIHARIGSMLGIHKCLRILYPYNRDLVYLWVTTENKAFKSQTPIEVMKSGFEDILVVRRYLESSCEY
ncbi:MAG: hypothetical protein A2X79_00735 [Desulfuromonadaceae bacterium GWB2_53_15]|nr:MAG: hypothetical protein A2X79_00735 [Desulfuromonadaceae bacterium GWB2_53_15]